MEGTESNLDAVEEVRSRVNHVNLRGFCDPLEINWNPPKKKKKKKKKKNKKKK
jgi:hypothetical protein